MGLCALETVDRSVVEAVEAPPATETWNPISHGQLITIAEETFDRHGLQVVDEQHALTHGNSRYFGWFKFNSKDSEHAICAALRHGLDKVLSIIFGGGLEVFICTNMSIDGDESFSCKHSKNVVENLSKRMDQAVRRLVGPVTRLWQMRIAAYKQAYLELPQVHDLLIRGMSSDGRRGVLAASQLPKVLDEYRNPTHGEFAQDWSIWRLYMAYTEILKQSNPFDLGRRSQLLHELLDEPAGISPLVRASLDDRTTN